MFGNIEQILEPKRTRINIANHCILVHEPDGSSLTPEDSLRTSVKNLRKREFLLCNVSLHS